MPFPDALRRRPRPVPTEGRVRTSPLAGEPALPLVYEPADEGVDLAGWTRGHRYRIEEDLRRHGALLFRGFGIDSAQAFRDWMTAACGDLLPYDERSSPRRELGGHVFTSTEYPPDRAIPFHNESSYRASFPGKLAFCCVSPAVAGGETPIAHTGRVLRRLAGRVAGTFAREGWSWVRHYRPGLGLSWQESFQSDEPRVVEQHCLSEDVSFEWLPAGRLRTRAVRKAVARHPQTGELTWFNHISFFHVSSLDDDIRASLLSQFSPEELPANTYHADGSEIDPRMIAEIRAAYSAEEVRFPWQRGDVLLLDNLMVAHARASFEGDRRVLVAMACPLTAAMVTVP